MSYADVFGGQGSPQWVTLATGVGGKSQTVPARSMSGYRFRNMSGCVVQLVVDGTLQDEFEPYSEGSGYLGYPGQSIQQVQYLVQNGDPVELSNYAVSSWRCLVELVPVDLPYQRVRMSATITGTVQLAAGTTIGVSGTVGVGGTVSVGNTPGVTQSGGPWSVGTPKVYLGFLTGTGPYASLTKIGTMAIDQDYVLLFFGAGVALTRVAVFGSQSGLTFFDSAIAAGPLYPCPLPSAQDSSVDVYVQTAVVGTFFLPMTAVRHSALVVPSNFGSAPLIVQPASGSSQTVVPGTSASSILAAVSTGLAFTRLSLGGALTRPSAIYAAAWGASASMTTGTAGTQGWGSIVFLGVKGVTSGSELWLAACGLQIPAVNVGVAANEVAAAGGFTVFPYPLSLASLLPTDTQVQPQLAYVLLSGVVPTGALALLD